nr:WW domain-binding protein 11-like [Manis javanica]
MEIQHSKLGGRSDGGTEEDACTGVPRPLSGTPGGSASLLRPPGRTGSLGPSTKPPCGHGSQPAPSPDSSPERLPAAPQGPPYPGAHLRLEAPLASKPPRLRRLLLPGLSRSLPAPALVPLLSPPLRPGFSPAPSPESPGAQRHRARPPGRAGSPSAESGA